MAQARARPRCTHRSAGKPLRADAQPWRADATPLAASGDSEIR
jgi:hypothetical protein